MANWISLRPQIIPWVSGCPDFVIENSCRSAARRFFTESRALVEKCPVFLRAGCGRREFILPDDYTAIAINNVWYNGVLLSGVESRAAFNDTKGTPRLYSADLNGIDFFPTPEDDKKVTVELVVAPSLTSKGLKDSILNRYAEALSYGAIAEICSMAGHAWFNPEMSQHYRDLFQTEITQARIDIDQGYTGSSSVNMRPLI